MEFVTSSRLIRHVGLAKAMEGSGGLICFGEKKVAGGD